MHKGRGPLVLITMTQDEMVQRIGAPWKLK